MHRQRSEEVVIRHVAEDGDHQSILSNALGVLAHTEFFEPVRNLLRCCAFLRRTCGSGAKTSDQRSDVNLAGEAQGTSAL
jgi:hypothetical protein